MAEVSRFIGDRLPSEILEAWSGRDLEGKVGRAWLLVSVDEDGVPRPCMLSAGELLALDAQRIRVALWPGTRTSRNLARGSPVLICHVEPGSVIYVKGRPRALGRDPRTRLERFEVAVQAVESDEHSGMPVTQGISFRIEGDRAATVASWEAQLRALAEADQEPGEASPGPGAS